MMHRKTKGGRRYRRRISKPVIGIAGACVAAAAGIALLFNAMTDSPSPSAFPQPSPTASQVPETPRLVVTGTPTPSPSPTPKATPTRAHARTPKPVAKKTYRPPPPKVVRTSSPAPARTTSPPPAPKPSPTPTRAPSPTAPPSREQQLYALVVGARHGCPIRIDDSLSRAAERWSVEMQRTGFRHSPPLWYGMPVAENIAYGWGGAQATFNAWMNSPGHRANILNCSYTHIGIGQDNDWWTAAFS